MDRFHWSQDETGIHPEEIGGPTDDRWLVLYLLLYVRDGNFRIGELAERLGGMGFEGVTPGRLHKTMQQLEEKGLLKEGPSVPDGDISGSGAVKQRYGLTPAGDYYLRIWGDSLEQYGRELGHFLHVYRGGRIARTSPYRMNADSGRDGRDGAGTVFILTSSGLRHMGLGLCRSARTPPVEAFSAIFRRRSSGETQPSWSTKTICPSSGFSSPWSWRSQEPRRASRFVFATHGEIGYLWTSAC
jgi:DNA-binding PadR family transcriptional regulator